MYELVITSISYGILIMTLIFTSSLPKSRTISSKQLVLMTPARYFKTSLPHSWPGPVGILIWQFTSDWYNFLLAVSLTDVAIVNYGINMTAAVIASLPTLIVYIFLGRYFIRGMLAGSLKS